MYFWLQGLLTSELVNQLRHENEQLRQEKNRLQDLILEHAGYLKGDTLPGEREEVKPISAIRTRRDIKLELEKVSKEQARLEIEEYRKKVVS